MNEFHINISELTMDKLVDDNQHEDLNRFYESISNEEADMLNHRNDYHRFEDVA